MLDGLDSSFPWVYSRAFPRELTALVIRYTDWYHSLLQSEIIKLRSSTQRFFLRATLRWSPAPPPPNTYPKFSQVYTSLSVVPEEFHLSALKFTSDDPRYYPRFAAIAVVLRVSRLVLSWDFCVLYHAYSIFCLTFSFKTNITSQLSTELLILECTSDRHQLYPCNSRDSGPRNPKSPVRRKYVFIICHSLYVRSYWRVGKHLFYRLKFSLENDSILWRW